MANKAKPDANNKKAHPWNHCPIGYHYVREHLVQISPNNKNPTGIVVTRHAHCRKNHGLKEAQMYLIATTQSQDAKGNQYQPPTAPTPAGNGDDLYSKIPEMVTLIANDPSPEKRSKVNPKLVAQLDPALLKEYGVNSPDRLAAFMAQIGVETIRFSTDVEGLKNTDKYDGGSKYRGRGLIQLTGKTNYANYGKAISADLINNPELAADPKYSLLIALTYWKNISGNKLADKGDITKLTKAIQGPKAPQASINLRTKYYKMLKEYLENNT